MQLLAVTRDQIKRPGWVQPAAAVEAVEAVEAGAVSNVCFVLCSHKRSCMLLL